MKKILKIAKEIAKENKSGITDTPHFVAACLKENINILTISYDKAIEIIKTNYEYDDDCNRESFVLKKVMKESKSISEALYKIFYTEDNNANMFEEYINENFEFEHNTPKYLFNLSNKEYITNPAIGRDATIEAIQKVLMKLNKPNILLIGEPGIGKTAVAEGIAYKIKNGECHEAFKNIKLVSCSVNDLLAGTKYRGEFEEKVKELCDWLMKNKNYKLYIDEMHSSVKDGGSEGAIDMANALKPYLARGDIRVIGCTTLEEYEIIKNNKAYSRRFTKMLLLEPTG